MDMINTIFAWVCCWQLGRQLGLIYILTHDRRQVPEPLVMAAFLTQCFLLPGILFT